MLNAALAYAARGWRVFPLHGIVNGICTCGHAGCSSAGKHPLVKRGLYEATTDLIQIQEWWRRWRCANVGVATGSESGIAVIDIDLPDAVGSLGQLIDAKLPPTLVGLTGGGGLHLIYRCVDATLGNSAGRLPGLDDELPGVDLRGNGGYVVAPPSVHSSGRGYEWLSTGVPLAPVPAWLKQPDRTYVELNIVRSADFTGDGTAYGLAALDQALTSLRGAPLGRRNHTLNREAFAMAQLVAGGELLGTAARSSLLGTALTIGLDEPESRQTIDSAFDAGLRQPRVAPHRLA